MRSSIKVIILTLSLVLVYAVVLPALPKELEFQGLDQQIRDGLISKAVARREFRHQIVQIQSLFHTLKCSRANQSEWVFPLEGYGPSAIGGRRGNGYRATGYDYFDGNRHGGHPSQDIFIRDKDQDSLDDYTHLPVRIRSISSGIVVAVNERWDASSALRGGIYIWIYDSISQGLFYYAHLRSTSIKLGQCVKPGTIIGEVGRTGLNAFKRRSPTHLHLTYLQIIKGHPEPNNIYPALLKAKLILTER